MNPKMIMLEPHITEFCGIAKTPCEFLGKLDPNAIRAINCAGKVKAKSFDLTPVYVAAIREYVDKPSKQ